MNYDWIPRSGSLDQTEHGDTSQKTVQSSISKVGIFVREVIANSLDAAQDLDNSSVRIDLELFELTGEDKLDYFNHLKWDSIKDHYYEIYANDKKILQKNPGELVNNPDKPVKILKISDYNTRGLIGPEVDSQYDQNTEKRFLGLCKSVLGNERGTSQHITGTYGLGKSVLWRYNFLRMVYMYSKLNEPFVSNDGIEVTDRLYGVARLKDHFVGGNKFSKLINLGVNDTITNQPYTRSLWNEDAREAAQRLWINPYEKDEFGTSIVIVGFDTKDESITSSEVIIEKLIESVQKYFWPAIINNLLEVRVGLNGTITTVNPEKNKGVKAFINLYKSLMRNPDQRHSKIIDVSIPSMGSFIESSAKMLIGIKPLASGLGDPEYTNLIAKMRDSGMIINYDPLKSASVESGNAIGLVIGGSAVPDTISGYSLNDQEHLEQFLSMSEPVAHDKWYSDSDNLEDIYGSKSRLTRLLKHINQSISNLLYSREGVVLSRNSTILSKLISLGGSTGSATKSSEIKWETQIDLEKEYIENDKCIVHHKVKLNVPKKQRCKIVENGKKPTHFVFHPIIKAIDESGAKLNITTFFKLKIVDVEMTTRNSNGTVIRNAGEFDPNSSKYYGMIRGEDCTHTITYISNEISRELAELMLLQRTHEIRKAVLS